MTDDQELIIPPEQQNAPQDPLAAPGSWQPLGPALLAFITGCRWFRGKARDPQTAVIRDSVPAPAGIRAYVLIVEVAYAAGKPEVYVVPVVTLPEEGQKKPAGAVIGQVRSGRETLTISDALADVAFCRGLLEAMGREQSFSGELGQITMTPTSLYAELMKLPPGRLEPVPVGAEQSNTSVVFGKQVILKLFRRLEEGVNPEVEIGHFLTEQTSFTGISRVAGSIAYRYGRRKPVSLAVLHEYVPNRGDAWSYTLEAVREYLAQARELADRPEEVAGIGPYRDSARLLGRRTAELHRALASGVDDPDFAPEPFSRDYRESLYRSMRKTAIDSLQLLQEHFDELPEDCRDSAAHVLNSQTEIIERFQQLKRQDFQTARIRAHGDFHLGQVLYTGNDFIIIDFEGEPARPPAERRVKVPPLKDLAGMLRSFHYAVRTVFREQEVTTDAENDQVSAWCRRWYVRVSAVFLDTYHESMRDTGLLPENPGDFKLLLDAFLLEKALYELGYELNNRPDWVGIPLQGILDLLGAVMEEEAREPAEAAPPAPAGPSPVRYDVTLLSGDDLYLFNEGTHYRLYEKLGAHPMNVDGEDGVYFAVWAPNASAVSVAGDFNGWDKAGHRLRERGSSGIWEGWVPGVTAGINYKYHIVSHHHGYRVDKADPFAFCSEVPPRTASVTCDLSYEWSDQDWMRERRERNSLHAPISIYELHPGSWQRVPEEGNRYLTYRELAPRLANYLRETGFTHVEFMPIMEHPFYGSWGYQSTGYFSPTSRYGAPQDFMYLVDYLHQQGIGVILDWVPSHFPSDEHGLAYFDGTHLFEHADPRQRVHPDWDSYLFNYSRNEVRSFLISSAMFWLDRYHADGLRVDAVASMLYLDYGRREGGWVPNKYGGRENLDAIAFLKQLNQEVYGTFPDVQTIAEESTSWPMVSRPTYVGGLGFGLKWDMGWMHDTLEYMSRDPVYRKFHHNDLTFRMIYAFYENFVLPLSHDEVVHGKASLLGKMPGDDWQKFANLRLLFGYMYAQSAKKLLFMGAEFGQWREWDHESSLDWHLLQYGPHAGLLAWIKDLNALYREQPALHQLDTAPEGFRWIDCNDVENSVVSLVRYGTKDGDMVVAACNFTPQTLFNYRIGMPLPGTWREALNSDAPKYYGSGQVNPEYMEAEPVPMHGHPQSLSITFPPLGAVFLTRPA